MSTLMLILFLVVVLVPGVLWLGLGGTDSDRGPDERDPRQRPYPASGELPEILRRPLRARL